ncbi:hypothetical protein IQ270_03955 [Microcoleus sp. LEGE 07076]|uniref:hypothetical protein n=1 Tax=Microcoleus sp. LEGE 07076 TaxID=915322 RepID=UPI00187F3718|nr:hypothetical protein [Microcoleus sp. LEGE 07076]
MACRSAIAVRSDLKPLSPKCGRVLGERNYILAQVVVWGRSTEYRGGSGHRAIANFPRRRWCVALSQEWGAQAAIQAQLCGASWGNHPGMRGEGDRISDKLVCI